MPEIRQISRSELEAMLADPDIPDEDIRPYLQLSTQSQSGFAPIIEINPQNVTSEGALEASLALPFANNISRWRRHARYKSKVKNWDGLKAVSEGDSWFQYPFLLDDVIDQLFDDYAILSLGAAGDLLRDIIKQDELVSCVAREKPDFVMLSACGNDLLGDGRLKRYVQPYDPARPPEDYLRPSFQDLLSDLLKNYEILVMRLHRGFPELKIFSHSYDFAIPESGRWLGRPLENLGILDRQLQRDIIKVIVERFHQGLETLEARAGLNGAMVLVDCRTVVGPSEWHDELHPDNTGYKKVASEFRKAIDDAFPKSTLEARPADARFVMANEYAGRDYALKMSERVNEDTLLAEIGRRATLAAVDPLAPQPYSAESVGGNEIGFETFKELGKRILARLSRELHKLLCGDSEEDEADREDLKQAFGLGEAAVTGAIVTLLTGSFGVLPGIAVIVAALLANRVLKPTAEETCTLWGETLAPDPA